MLLYTKGELYNKYYIVVGVLLKEYYQANGKK